MDKNAAINSNTFFSCNRLNNVKLGGVSCTLISEDAQGSAYVKEIKTGDITSIVISVIEYDGYKFDKWDDEDTNMTRELPFNSDIVKTANFKQDETPAQGVLTE